MITRHFTAVIGLIIATSAGLAAQGTIHRVQPPPSGLRFAETWRPPTTRGDTRIIGTVMDVRQVPVVGARVQLRSLVTGEVQQETESDENGEYEFTVVDPGTYVVEMVLVDGYVIALSNAGSLARYETLQTVVQLAGRWDSLAASVVMPTSMTNFVGMSAAATMTADTLTLAAQQDIAPVDPGEPVSP
jgi:hypothetical protein